MKKQVFCNFITIYCITILGAQNWSGGGGNRPAICEVSGVVVDSKSEKPIEYASVSVLLKDKSIETGGITDSNGKFQIGEIRPGNYILKIEFMGYESQTISDIKLSFRGKTKKDVGKIKLKLALLEMDEVNVVDDRPVFEFETDKMIYNAKDDIISGSGTAEDVLNKVPMVTVDQDGEVSLRGNPNVKILLNGRPNRTGGDVDIIPASLIDKVEVITSPSAKYDPEGMAGIINIVLKKGTFEGLNGSIKSNMKHNEFNSVGDMNGFTFYVNYQKNKFNIYSSYSLNNRMRTRNGYRRIYNLREGNREYNLGNYDYDFSSIGDRFGQSFNLGTDYSINENLILNIDLNIKNYYKDNSNYQIFFQEDTLAPYIEPHTEASKESEDDNNVGYDVFCELKKTYETPDKEILIAYGYNHNNDSEYETIISDTSYINNDKNNYEIDINYKVPLNEKSKLELGYDGRFNSSKENMKFQLSGEENNEPSWIFLGNNDFDYSRTIHAFFAEYQIELNDRFSLKPSIRIENVNKNINFIINDTTITGTPQSVYAQYLLDKNFEPINVKETNFFPDLHLTYNITEKQNIQLGVSKRIKRPSGGGHWGQLRPFPKSVYNDKWIFIGNPFLKPEFSTQYEISFKSPMPMGFFYTNLYYRNIENSIQWDDYELDGDFSGKATTFSNAEDGTDMGMEAFMMVMGQTIGGGYNINELYDSSNDFNLNGKNERINMYMRINVPEEYIKLFGFEFSFYYMRMKVPGGTLFGDSGTIWAKTGISKSLLNNRVNVSLSIDNLFDKGGFQMQRAKPMFDGGEEITEIFSTRGGRTLSLSIKYNFGKLQEEKRKTRRTSRGGNESMDMGY